MKIINKYPPNYSDIEKRFDLRGRKPIFAYGEVLYNPHGVSIDPSFIVHEETHQKQQAKIGDVEEWWRLYLTDDKFMLAQEVEAYQVQYEWAKENMARPQRRALLKFISQVLGSPMYGSLVTVDEARELILGELEIA
jgi:hypothetical protein